MQRYVSVRANAKYFTECVTKCLIDNKHREPTEKDFWDFVSTIQFENDVISRNCKFFKTMKAFADRHSIARPANIWKITFENADENTVRSVILFLQDEKLRRQEEREERKNDEYKAALDEFNSFARCIKFKLAIKEIDEELLEAFVDFYAGLSDEIPDRIDMYRENAAPLDDRFRDYLSYMKLEVRRQSKSLVGCPERMGAAV